MLENKQLAKGFICIGIVAIVAAIVVSVVYRKSYSTDVPPALDEAVTHSFFTRMNVSRSDITVNGKKYYYAAVGQTANIENDSFYMSECVCEWHRILGYSNKKDQTEAYTLCGMSGYGFRNGKFVNNCGYTVPTLIVFYRDKDGNYIFKEAKEAKDGSEYSESIRKMFPKDLAYIAINAPSNDELMSSLDEYSGACAEAYLTGIGRSGTLGEISDEDEAMLHGFGVADAVEAKLYKLHPEYGEYIGNFEKTEDGVRYVYSVKWDGDDEGNGTVTYTKKNYDTGKTVKKYAYKIEKGKKLTEIKSKKK